MKDCRDLIRLPLTLASQRGEAHLDDGRLVSSNQLTCQYLCHSPQNLAIELRRQEDRIRLGTSVLQVLQGAVDVEKFLESHSFSLIHLIRVFTREDDLNNLVKLLTDSLILQREPDHGSVDLYVCCDCLGQARQH